MYHVPRIDLSTLLFTLPLSILPTDSTITTTLLLEYLHYFFYYIINHYFNHSILILGLFILSLLLLYFNYFCLEGQGVVSLFLNGYLSFFKIINSYEISSAEENQSIINN